MKNVITNAAEITVLEPLDNTYKTGGGPVSVGGCVILANKGRPFTVHEIFGVDTSQEDISALLSRRRPTAWKVCGISPKPPRNATGFRS